MAQARCRQTMAVKGVGSHRHSCPTWVVACGRQQNTASTALKSTSSILTREGTDVAVTRCGKTSENGCDNQRWH
jgi:hypothetical protein